MTGRFAIRGARGRVSAAVLAVFALLAAAAAGASWVAWDFGRHLQAAERDSAAVQEAVDRAARAVDAIAEGQQGYVAAGQDLRRWLDQVSAAIQLLYRDTAALGSTLHGDEALAALAAFEDTLATIVQTDTQIRERLRVDDLAAARQIVDLEADAYVADAHRRLEGLRHADATGAAGRVSALRWRMAGAGILAVLLAALGVAQLWLPSSQAPATVEAAVPAATTAASEWQIDAPILADGNAAPDATLVDLTALVAVCSELSQVASVDRIPDLLARAATALGASGLIVWLERDDRLVPVFAHGYDERAVQRMGTIDRTAGHAAATAWTTATLQTVPAGGTGRSAIVAPLGTTGACIGVLTAEVPPGADADPQRRAAAGLLAAQLAARLDARDDAARHS